MSDAPEPSERAMAAATVIAEATYDNEGCYCIQPEEGAAILDEHFAGYDALLAACKASAQGPHSPDCRVHLHYSNPRYEPGHPTPPCNCHVIRACDALALAEPEEPT